MTDLRQLCGQRPLVWQLLVGVLGMGLGLTGASVHAQGKAPADVAPATTFTVSMTARLTVNTTHPMARHWGLQCGAIIGSWDSTHAVVQAIEAARNSFQANTAQSTDQTTYDQFAQSFLNKAHYYGSESTVDGELRNGAYSGTHTVTVTVPVSQLIDPTTKAVYAQPVALVGCWITINERPVLRARGNELATKDNFNHASMNYVQYFMDGTLIKSASP